MTRLLPLFLLLTVLHTVVARGESQPLIATDEPPGRAAPRVVLLVEDSDLEALLLSGFPEVRMLSRTDLPTTIAERMLTEGNLALIGAEAVLVVERQEDRGIVRIVDCASGATVVALDLPPLPVEETARWIVTRAEPFLGATAGSTRPRISLPGLRFVTDSAQNRSVERSINLLLTTRLQARGAIVLERWRMRDLVFEKSLNLKDSPFWNAARMIDGSVSPDGDGLRARVRIRDATGAENIEQAVGRTAAELCDHIATLVFAEHKGTSADTKQTIEAQAYLAETRWMLEHGLPHEAWQAVEAAIALSAAPMREAEMLRVKAAAMCAYPDELKVSGYGQDGGYRARAIKLKELPVRVAAATEAVLLAGDYWNAHPPVRASRRGALEDPDSLGIRTLYTGLRVLRASHDLGWSGSNPEATRSLRNAIRRAIAIMKDGPLGNRRTNFLIYLTNYAGYWSETPEEAVNFYRTVLAPDFDAGLASWPEAIRGELAYGRAPHPPILAGVVIDEDIPFGIGAARVIAPNQGNALVIWDHFLAELARSPHVLNRADSLALTWQSTADKNIRVALAARMADFMSENSDVLSGPFGYSIFHQFLEPFRHAGRSPDFMVGQQRLTDAYIALIRSESAVSPKIFGSTWALLESSNKNATEAQGREILAALDARLARSAPAKEELAGIDSARSSVWRRFPSLRPTADAKDLLRVRSLWIAAEHSPDELRRHIGFSPEATVWEEGFLWSLDPHHGRLWQIDPTNGDATVHSPANCPKPGYESRLVSWGHRFAITAEQGVWVLDETKDRWDKLDLPEARYHIGTAHGYLWAASGERAMTGRLKQVEGNTLYRILPELACELVASSRRRPPVHPLDTAMAGMPFSITPFGDENVLIGSYGDGWRFLDSGNATPPAPLNEHFVGKATITSNPDLMVSIVHQAGDKNRLVRIEKLNANGAERLITHPSRDSVGTARFAYPQELDDLPATEYVATWHDNALYILAWSRRGSPWGAAEAWLLSINEAGHTSRPLTFEWSEAADKRALQSGHEPRVWRHPSIDAKGLISTDHGLVITGRAMHGFWFIPNEDLDRAGTKH